MFHLASIYTIFQPLIKVNEAIVKFWHNDVGVSWGASIIGLTVVIRLAILPLTFKQVRSMQALQRLQPEMKRLQERYKDDKKRLNEEMMKFYREHKVNPFGSCLPLLLQLPFFFSLYGLQRSARFKADVCPPHGHCTGSGGEHFLFIPNILKPLTGHPAALIVIIILYVVTMLGSSLVTAVNIQDKNQRRLMLALPFVFVPVILRFPAGLLVYWITTNVWTIGQQLFVKRFLPPPEPLPATATAGAQATPRARGDGKAPAEERRPPAAAKAKERSQDGSQVGDGQKAPPRAPRKRKKRSGRRR